MDAAQSYGYPGEKLDLEDAFRLVEVQPGERDTPVTVHLLASGLHVCLPYEALSYAWGDATQTEDINVIAFTSCGESSSTAPLSVTLNCAAALKRLRLPTKPRMLWIDAICIDQSSVPERNHQLGLMPLIYSEATCVVVYLGGSSDTENSDGAMDWLVEAHESPQSSLTSGLRPVSESVPSLLGRPWFRRTWVLQEIRLAKRAVVVCGTKEVSWEAFNQLRYNFDNGMRAEPLPYAVQSLANLNKIRRKTWTPPYPARLLKLLQNTRCLEATDARDKLHAVLPLLDWEDKQRRWGVKTGNGDQASFAVPKGDYSRSPAETFTLLARALIDALGLNVLRSVVTPTKVPGLPTWAPDWSTHGLRSFRGSRPPMRLEGWTIRETYASGNLISKMTADGAGHKPWKFSDYLSSAGDQNVQLHVRAAMIGTIVKMGELCDIYRNYLPLEQWESICQPWHLQETPVGESEGAKYPGQAELERLPPFIKALFGPFLIYASTMLDAVQRVREFHRQETAGPLNCIALGGNNSTEGNHTDGRVLLRHIFASWHPSAKVVAEQLFSNCHGRRFFVTDAGHLGLAPEATMIGDQVVGIEGLGVPFVARSAGSGDANLPALQLVGQCHAKKALNSAVDYEDVVIR